MMRPEDSVFGLVVLPLLGAAIAFCSKAFLHGRAAKWLEYGGMIVGLFLPWLVLAYTLPLVWAGNMVEGVVGNWHSSVGIMFRFDGLAWLVNVLGYLIAGAAWIYSLGAGPHGPLFSAIFLIQTAALSATAMTADLFNLFVCLEVMGIASYVLVASSEKPGAFLAAYSYLMVSATSMVFFLLGLYGLYRLTGALSYDGIAIALQAAPNGGGSVALISFSLIVAAVAMRVAVMPLYGWLPDAHALAPHAISAVLSGVLIKTPLFALSRVLLMMPAAFLAGQLMGFAGAVTALVAVVIALSQKDAKRLLAYHSISQIGYVVSAWGAAIHAGVGSKHGLMLMTAAFLHAFYHAMFKGLLFLTVGTTTDRAGERNVYLLRNGCRFLKKSGEKVPVTVICFFLAALAITAIPPLNGFASKTALSYGLKGTWQYYFLFAAGIGTMASFIKLSRIYWPEKRPVPAVDSDGTRTVPSACEARPSVLIAQVILGVACVVTGMFAPFIHAFVFKLLSGKFQIEKDYLVTGPSLYTGDNLLKTAILVGGGFLLFLLAGSAPGKRVLAVIRERPRDFQGLFLSFSLGTAAMAVWLMLFR